MQAVSSRRKIGRKAGSITKCGSLLKTVARAGIALKGTQERYRLAARATNDAVWDWILRPTAFSGTKPDGNAGLKVLQSNTRIDLLITDVGLPGGMNGRQMADTARTYRSDLEVLSSQASRNVHES